MASYPTQTITSAPKKPAGPNIDANPLKPKSPLLPAAPAQPTGGAMPAPVQPTAGLPPMGQPVLKPGAPPTGGGTPSAQPTAGAMPGPGTTPIMTSQVQPSTGATAGPGTTPIGAGMIPGTPPNPYTTQFGPGNDLQTTQINPYANPRLQGTQSAVDAATASLAGAPSRQQAAADQFAAFLGAQGEEFDRRTRELTQRAGATGRLGSGMYGSDLVDMGTAFNRDAQRQASQLAYDTVGGDINDRFNTVNTLAGLEGQQFGQGLTQRNELRGERGYQNDYAQQGFNNSLTQFNTEQQAQNQQAQQLLAQLGLIGQFGYGGQNPSGLLGQFAGDIQQSAGQTGAGAGDLLTQWLLSQAGG